MRWQKRSSCHSMAAVVQTKYKEKETSEMRAIGDLALYGTCTVKISSVTGRGIAAPFYRFSCVDYGHEHPKGWGDLTSHRLLADVPPPDRPVERFREVA